MILGYLLTFCTYGSWLHGEFDGSVDHEHNRLGTSPVKPDPIRLRHERSLLKSQPVRLSDQMRFVVGQTVDEVCTFRGWQLHTSNVRTNHVHVVVTASMIPERIMTQLKAKCTQRMREARVVEPSRKIWARHGSTRYLKTPRSLERAIVYVREEQGDDLPTRLPPGWLDEE